MRGAHADLKVRREAVAQMIRQSEDDLSEVRNSAALGGNSRTILLHLERQLHAGRKTLAAIDAELARDAASGGAAAVASFTPPPER